MDYDYDAMRADEAFDRAEDLRWKRELEDDEFLDPTIRDNGDGASGWPR